VSTSGGLAVQDLIGHDDVGIAPQHGLKLGRVVEIGLGRIPLDVVDADDLEQDFALEGLDVAGVGVVPADEAVHGGRQPVPRRGADEHDAVPALVRIR
jgi:hypothetical protein